MGGHPAVIEFFGIPGAGKSTLSERVAELLRARGLSVDTPTYDLAHGRTRLSRVAQKLRYVLAELMHHPAACIRAVWGVRQAKQVTPKDFIRVLVNWWFVAGLVRGHDAAVDVRILDQGICQALWSVGFSAKADASLLPLHALLWECMPIPEFIVMVEARESTIAERLRLRSGRDSRIERTTAEDRGILMTRAFALYENIKREVTRRSVSSLDLSVITIENESADVDRSAREVVDRLSRCLEPIK